MLATIKRAGLPALAMMMVASLGAKADATTTAVNWTLVSKDAVVTVVTNGPAVTANFPASPVPLETSAILRPVAPSSGAFTGNYARVKASSIGLTAVGNFAMSAASYVRLSARTGRFWARYSLTNGVNEIPLTRVAGGWTNLFASADDDTLDAYWSEDMQQVSGVIVHLKRNMSAPGTHSVTVSNFQLKSDRAVGAAPASLEQELLDEFGVSSIGELTEEQMIEDDDTDGMTDLDEILAEQDPCGQTGEFAQGIFEAEVATVGDGTAEISFACVGGESYTIYRSLTIGGASTVVGTRYPIETGFDSITDMAAGSGAAFYTVRQNCP